MAGKPVTLLNAARGLNNAVDPTRLEAGEQAAAVNVDIDATGRINRRLGYVQKRAEPSHSLFCDGGDCLFVSGDTLYRLHPDYSREALRTGLTENAPLSCAQVADSIYYVNGFEKGRVPTGAAHTDWVAGDYVGPTTIKAFSDPPLGHLVSFFGGRVLVARGEVIWFSEPFAYGWFNLAKNWVSEAERITMLAPVEGGLFVGTTRSTLFYAGQEMTELTRLVKIPYAPIEGTLAYAPGQHLGVEADRVALWTTDQGLFAGGPGGSLVHLTDNKLVLPPATRGAGLVYNHKYVTMLQE